jgi:hypothetical protein
MQLRTAPVFRRAMLKHLLGVYEESRLNVGRPECLFAETEIFREGWLLRSVLKEWKTGSASSKLPFLPFPDDARVYSGGQLFTPFKARRRGDPRAETNTRIDGIAPNLTDAAALFRQRQIRALLRHQARISTLIDAILPDLHLHPRTPGILIALLTMYGENADRIAALLQE